MESELNNDDNLTKVESSSRGSKYIITIRLPLRKRCRKCIKEGISENVVYF